MVAIIDDRFDVWDFSSHLVHIKPCKYIHYILKKLKKKKAVNII